LFVDKVEAARFVTSLRSGPLRPLAKAERAFVEAQVVANLREKSASSAAAGRPFPLTVDVALRTVGAYEVFKFRTYVSSGVFPKRYFGYFDEAWDSATRERELRLTVQACTAAANRHLERTKRRLRVTEQEIAVTFIAEGGALLLRERQAEADAVHPVLGIGLDDIALGFARDADLVADLDRTAGTKLGDIVGRSDTGPFLRRLMTFREAIAGTTVMWVYEKALADDKLRAMGVDLATRDADTQFIVGSLVYNSGLAFDDARWAQVKAFATGDYLENVSRKNAKKRWLLPVARPKDARAVLLSTGAYPEQPTSWSAVYHVLQRWGGYAGLSRFSDVFDESGRYRARP